MNGLPGSILVATFLLSATGGAMGWVTLSADACHPPRRRTALLLTEALITIATWLWLVTAYGSLNTALSGARLDPAPPLSAVPLAVSALCVLLLLASAGAGLIGGLALRALLVVASPTGTAPAPSPRTAVKALALLLPIGWLLGTSSVPPLADAPSLAFALFLVGLPLAARGARRSAQSFQPRYDTQARILVLYLLTTFFLSASTVGAIATAIRSSDRGSPALLLVVVVLAAPALLAAGAYLAVEPILISAYDARPARDDPMWRRLLDSLRLACEEARVPPPVCLVSEIPALSPIIFGTTTTAYLVLPANYAALMKQLDEGLGRRTARALHRFVVQHELAHLVHKDYRLFTWLSAFLRLLVGIWCPLVFATLLATLWLLPVLSQAGLGPVLPRVGATLVAASFPATIVVLLYLLVRALQRDREMIADQRALKNLPPDQRSLLLEPPTIDGLKAEPPFALLLRLFPVQLTAGMGVASVDAPVVTLRTAWKCTEALRRRLVASHPPSAWRLAALRSTADPFLSRQGDAENGALLGALVALTHFVYVVALVLPGMHAPRTGGRPSHLFFLWLLAATWMVAMILYLPLREAPRATLSFEEYDSLTRCKAMYAVGGALLCSVIVFYPGAAMLAGSFRAGLPLKPLVIVVIGGYIAALLLILVRIGLERSPWPESATVKVAIALRAIAALALLAVL